MFFFGRKYSVWIYLDMEGINNITSWSEVDPGCIGYKAGQALMMDELNSCIKGISKGGAYKIFLNDLHWFSNNVVVSKLNKKATLLNGLNLVIPEFLSKKFDAIFIVGMHSKVNTKDGILSHSWYLPSYIQEINYNNKQIGEVDMINLLAEEKGIPVIFISGDKTGCEEQKQYNNAITAITKNCVNGIINRMSVKEANDLVYEKSKEAIKSLKSNVFKQKQNFYNYPMTVKFGNKEICESVASRCFTKGFKFERINDETIVFHGNIFSEILNNFFSVLD